MLSFLLCDHSFGRKGKQPWKEIEDEATRLHDLPSWNAPDNSLMFQAFEWHVPDDQAHWRRLLQELPTLKRMGVDNIWIPPGCKAMSPSGNGYDIYDLYDLGEFDQKGARPTKWGTKEELRNFISEAQDQGIGVYWDAVLNHKAGADFTERFPAVKVDPQNRNQEISIQEDIDGWVGFNFPGRGDQYSAVKYHWPHFNGVDWNDIRQEKAVFKTKYLNSDWATDVSNENGNYDYLMFANLDYSNPEVRDDVLHWGSWITTELPLSGMRLDAVKHYSAEFQKTFIDELRRQLGEKFFFVGEYWSSKINILLDYLERMDHQLSLFDVPLVDRFSAISHTKGADMRRIFDGTLVQKSPDHAVVRLPVGQLETHLTVLLHTLADIRCKPRHMKQPGQSLETPIAAFFIPLAYALILLREKGQPCLFYGDVYGTSRDNKHPDRAPYANQISTLTQARKLYANGAQRDYFDKANCIGFIRYGNKRHPSGLACILSNAGPSRKCMFVGRTHAGERWTDILNSREETVKINRKGYGTFHVGAYSVSVWVNSSVECRENLHQIL